MNGEYIIHPFHYSDENSIAKTPNENSTQEDTISNKYTHEKYTIYYLSLEQLFNANLSQLFKDSHSR